MTFEFKENDIEKTAEEEAEEEAEYETEEKAAEKEAEEEAEYETEEEAEYENEEEAEFETEENQVDDTETEEQQIEKNIEREVEQEETNTKKCSWILGVTTDNASNNITFLKAVESDLSQRYIYYDSDDKHIRCLAHVINLAAQQVLTTLKATDNNESSNEEVGSLIVKLHTLIKKIKASLQQVDKFKAQCKVANVPNLNVILDIRTRWNSTYDMLVSELYMTLYAPQETQNTNIEYNSSDKDLVSHISKWRHIESVSEFDRYLNADRAQALCDTLNWWKRHEEEYSNLSNMAKDYLGVSATSAFAKRIFSSAADVITYDRASLAPETLFGWRRIGYSGKLWMNNLHQKKMIDIISYDNLTSL
ncbi:zinc finger BED domain-containing protein 1-like [Rhizophagus irregularis DAOM 181602=DAOM 197198]|nr:zinc finger BED domain-containing protein 1-like [Rhizophagus irregularis DAOM 181602=DAOM 197198]